MGELRNELSRVKLHVGLASLIRLFGDTKLAQFNPAFKSFFQPLVSTTLLPHALLQEARSLSKIIFLRGSVSYNHALRFPLSACATMRS